MSTDPASGIPVARIAIDLAESHAAFERFSRLNGLMETPDLSTRLQIEAACATAKVHALRLQETCVAHGDWINTQIRSGLASQEHGPQLAHHLKAALGGDDENYAKHWAALLEGLVASTAASGWTPCDTLAHALATETVLCACGLVLDCLATIHTEALMVSARCLD